MELRLLSPETGISGLAQITVGHFWQWAYSDILSNRNRGIFAEFIVASALGVTDKPRIEWNAIDIVYRGKKIEVKSSAYLQNWQQSSLSKISFQVGEKQSWIAESNSWLPASERASDCYVFCIYSEQDPSKADVLDISKWEFYLVATRLMNEKLKGQKTIGLNSLKKIALGPVPIGELKRSIDSVLQGSL